jgi:hypothetical protein
MSRNLLLLLLVLLSTRVCPQLLVRLFAKVYPKGDPRAKEMVGEVYRIRPYQRPGWALEQAELAWFEGRQARALVRVERKERAAELAASARRAQLEERARQEEAEFDAFLRGACSARARHAAPRRQRRAALLPAVLLSSASLSFAGLAIAGPSRGGGDLQLPTVPLTWNEASSVDAVAAATVAVLLLVTATVAHALHAGSIQRLARSMTPYRGRYERPAFRVADPAIKVIVVHNGRTSKGLALAWGGGRVLVASPFGRAWTPATRVRRVAAA